MVAIDKFEQDWKYDASYMRDMIDASPRTARPFSRVTALAHDASADEYREAIVKRGGQRALVGGTPVVFNHSRAQAPTDVAVRTA